MPIENEEKTTASWMKEAQKGYIRMGVLILLNKKPTHGYEIMKEIKYRTKGFWSPTPGGVYPILRDLEESGYIEGEWHTQRNRKLKVYKITSSGALILKRAIVKQAEIANNIGVLFQEFTRDVLNVETEPIPTPNMAGLFSPFLEENPDSCANLKLIEQQRKHLAKTLKLMKEKLKLTEKRIAELKKLQTIQK